MTDQPSFTCPDCGATSHHPDDVANGYCGRCHAFTGSRGSGPVSTMDVPTCGGCGQSLNAMGELSAFRRLFAAMLFRADGTIHVPYNAIERVDDTRWTVETMWDQRHHRWTARLLIDGDYMVPPEADGG